MRIVELLKFFVIAAVVFTPTASWAQSSTGENEKELPTLADIAAFAEYSGIKISPDGAHLAVRKEHEGKNALVILKTDTLEPVHLQGFTGRDEVAGFWWISDERILFSKRFYTAGQEAAVSAGEYFAMNVDGSQYVYAFGYQNVGGGSKSRNCGLDYRGSAGFIAALNDRDVLMSYQPWLQGGLPELYRVNTKSCKVRRVARGKYPTSRLYLDADNEPRVNMGYQKITSRSLPIVIPIPTVGSISIQSFLLRSKVSGLMKQGSPISRPEQRATRGNTVFTKSTWTLAILRSCITATMRRCGPYISMVKARKPGLFTE